MNGALVGASGFELKAPILMLVTDRHSVGGADALVEAVDAAIGGGVNAVQLREKDLSPAELLPLAVRLREVTAGRALFLVNGPLGVALEAAADGVHLPEYTVAPPPPWTFTWGRSVHTTVGALQAVEGAARYLIAGPLYSTATHPKEAPAGVQLIREIVPASRVPVIGIGGITQGNARDVIQAGASGVAVISAILGSPDPGASAQALSQTIQDAWPVRRVVP